MADPIDTAGAVDAYLNSPARLGAQARMTMMEAVGTKPDYEAELQKVAKRTGVPVDTVRAFPDEMKKQATLGAYDFDGMATEFPNTAKFLSDRDKAAIAHDETGTLKSVEQGFGSLLKFAMGNGPNQGFIGAGKAAPFVAASNYAGVKRAAVDLVEPFASVVAGPDNLFARSSALYGQQEAAFDAQAKAVNPPQQGIVAGGLDAGGNSLVQNAKYLPLALFGGPVGAAIALGGMAAETFGQSYNKAADKGIPLGTRVLYAAADGVIEWGTEKGPLGALIHNVKAGTPFMQSVISNAWKENKGEQVATLLQDLNEWGVLNPDKPFSDYIKARPAAAAQTLIATLVGAGGNVAIAQGMQTVVDATTGRNRNFEYQARLAEHHAQVFEALQKTAEASKLLERSPDTLRSYMQDLADQGVPTVFVNSAALVEAGVNLQELAQALPSVAAQLEQADFAGDLAIPTGELLVDSLGTTFAQPLIEHARTSEGSMSRAEAQVFMQEQGDQLNAEIEQVLQQRDNDTEFKAGREKVQAQLLTQLNEVNRFTPAVNAQYATLAANFYAVMAARTGMTVEQFADTYKLGFAGQAGVGSQVLDQKVLNDLSETVFKPQTQADRDAGYSNRFKNPITLKDGTRLSGFTDPAKQTTFHGYDKNGEQITIGREYVKPEDIVSSRDSNRTADKVRAGLARATFNQAGRAKPYGTKIFSGVIDALGLTAEEVNSTVLEFMTGQSKDQAFVTPVFTGIPEVVQFLHNRRLASGLPVLDIKNAADREKLATLMAAEALAAIQNAGDSLQWYDKTINALVAQMAVKYPELNTDPSARNALLLATAIASQGLNVETNLTFAQEQYAEFRKTGKFPEDGKGKSADVMAGSFRLANELIAKRGHPAFIEFLKTPYTVKQLTNEGYDIGGEKMDELVLGSSVFGPKIGFGFYTNLNGNFEPVTMDMWFMRTIGRLSGTLPAFDQQKFDGQIARFREGLKVRGRANQGIFASQFDRDLVNRAKTDLAAAMELARLVKSAHEKDFKNNRADYDAGARTKSEMVAASDTMIISMDKPRDVPGSGGERQLLRDVVRQVVDKVEQQYGQRIPPAALQALIWYPEQELYSALGVKLAVTSQDYAGAAKKILLKDGIDETQLDAAIAAATGTAGKPGPGGVQQVLGGTDSGEEQGTGAQDNGNVRAQQGTTSGGRGEVDVQKYDQSSRVEEAEPTGDAKFDAVTTFRRAGADPYTRADRSAGSQEGDGRGPGLRLLDGTDATPLATFTPTAEVATQLNAAGMATPVLHELDPAQHAQAFHASITASKIGNKYAAAVHVYEPGEYAGMRLFMADGGKTGFALKGDDIVSVFNFEDANKGSADAMLEMAIQLGGRKLDAFDTVLPEIYARHGFEAVARTKWNDAYAPQGWDKQIFSKFSNGEPDVVFMAYNPARARAYVEGEGATFTGDEGYDQAVEAQQAAVDKPNYNQDARGQIAFGDDITQQASIISMLKGADLSTFIHEGGHFFLEVQADLAARIQARISLGEVVSEGERSILDDMNKLLDWMGVKGTPTTSALGEWLAMPLEEKRPKHELFARGFEAYAFEGKAPSLDLQKTFQTFRAWLVNVYRTVKDSLIGDTLNVQLTDEVRSVMDRMLATTDQITEAEAARNMGPLFKTAEQAGMTADEYKAYHDQGVQATLDAIDDLQGKGLRDMQWLQNARSRKLKELQKQHDALRAEITMQVRGEVMGQPIYRAWTFLTGRAAKPVEPGQAKIEADKEIADYKAKRAEAEQAAAAAEREKLYAANPDVKGLQKGQLVAKNKRQTGINVEQAMLDWDKANKAPDKVVEQDEMADPVFGTGKLNTEDLRKAYGKKDDALWRKLSALRMTSDEVGIHPDIVAEMFPNEDGTPGFTSGDHLVRALTEAEPPKSVIEGMTDQRMLEENGDLATPAGLERAADMAIHNDARVRFVATELAALQKAMSVREKVPGQRNTVDVLARAAKDYATAIIAKLKVRDVRPGQYTAAEVRSAKAAQKASGDLAQATLHKRNQLINMYAAKSAYAAQEEVKKAIEYFKKFDKASKSLDPEYQDQIHALLERFDLRQAVSLKAIDKRASLVEWVQSQVEQGLEPDIPPELLQEANRKSFKEMTVEEVRGLRDTIKQIEHIGRLKNKLLLARDQRDFDTVATAMAASIEANGGKLRPLELEGPNKIVDFFAGIKAMHRKLGSYFRQMDGANDAGPMYDAIGRGMNEKGVVEDVMTEQATKALQALYAPLLKLRGGISSYRSKIFIPAINASLTRGGRIAVALNWGNEANRQRIMDGDSWSQAQAEAVIATLTPVELDFVNKTWEYLDSYWPEVSAKEKRLTGLEPEKVQAIPFIATAADGTQVQMRGGYYPLKYDANRSDRTAQQDAAQVAKEMMQGAFTRATTRRGHTKARVETVNRAVRKDLNVITQHVSQVVHDLAWHEWLIDTNKLLGDKRVAGAIRDYYGPQALKTMRDAVMGIATADVVPQTKIDDALLMLRSNVTRATMGASLTTAFLQPFGLTQSMVRIGPQHVLRGLARWGGDAARMENTLVWVHDKSDFMRLRSKTFNKELREIRGSVEGKSKAMQAVDGGLFYMMQKLQMVADVPTWIGQYEKSTAEGLDEAAAVAMADRAVIESQGGGQTKDLAEVQRKHPLLTQFYSYFSVTLNLTIEQTAKTDFKNPRAVAGWLGDMALLSVIPAILPAMLMFLIKGGDEDEPTGWAKKLAEWQLGYLMGAVVGLRELTGALAGFDYAGPPVGRIVGDLGKLGKQAGQGEVDEPAVLALAQLIGTAFGIPIIQVMRSYKGWKAWDEGKEGAGPQSVLFGPPPKD